MFEFIYPEITCHESAEKGLKERFEELSPLKIDINRLVNDNQLDYRDYHNFFFETRMILPKDVTMSLEYGVGPAYNVQTSSTNPSMAFYSTAVLETQHIIRIIFDKKF